MKVVFFPCSNGYGHLKRCYLIASELAKFKVQSKIVFNKKDYENVCVKNKKKLIKNIDIPNYLLQPSHSFKDINKFKKLEKLIRFSKDTIIISDSYLEVLNFNYPIIILSNFYWFKILKTDQKLKRYFQNIINKKNPLILGSSIFAMPHIKQYKNFYSYNLIGKIKSNNIKKNNAILISSGKSKRGDKQFKSFGKEINKIIQKFEIVYLDRNLQNILKLSHPKIFIASFDNTMFSRLKFAIVRPGIGILNDLILRKVSFYTIYEENNSEMTNNSLKAIELGYSSYINDESIDKLIKKKKKFINNNGLEIICNKVRKIINSNLEVKC